MIPFLLVAGTSLAAWLILVFTRGWFWRTDHRLDVPGSDEAGGQWPSVGVIVPARNEAKVIPHTLPGLLNQDYPGDFNVVVVDDGSDDGTNAAALRAAFDEGQTDLLIVVSGEALPPGWTGKLWALEQGVRASGTPDYLLVTDADIAHDTDNLRALVRKSVLDRLDLVSVMARLRAQTPWERLLIPAFVYFFAKLYPFRWASDRRRSTAAAAGGCILLRRDALESAGGFSAIRGELIDDCALASRIKANGGIWLGLSEGVSSLRCYGGLKPVWEVVSRTAYVQLRFSLLNLLATVIGMLFLYLVPPVSAVTGLAVWSLTGESVHLGITFLGFGSWGLMSASYAPLLHWHGVSRLVAPVLPVAALLYTAMTVDSARRWRRGTGGGWKGRNYGRTADR